MNEVFNESYYMEYNEKTYQIKYADCCLNDIPVRLSTLQELLLKIVKYYSHFKIFESCPTGQTLSYSLTTFHAKNHWCTVKYCIVKLDDFICRRWIEKLYSWLAASLTWNPTSTKVFHFFWMFLFPKRYQIVENLDNFATKFAMSDVISCRSDNKESILKVSPMLENAN